MNSSDVEENNSRVGRRKWLMGAVLALVASGYVAYERLWKGWWLEEVMLADGTRIVVKRKISYAQSGPISNVLLDRKTYEEIDFVDVPVPVTKFRELGFSALVLDRDPLTHEWFVIGYIQDPYEWKHEFKPSTRYTAMRLRNGIWTPQNVAHGGWWRWTNLLIGIPPKAIRGDLILAADKLELNEMLGGMLFMYQIRPDLEHVQSPIYDRNLLVPERGSNP